MKHKKLILMLIMAIFCYKMAYAQKIYTFEEMEATKGVKRDSLEKIFDNYSALNNSRKMSLTEDYNIIFEGNMEEQKRTEQKIGRDFFVKFKTKADKYELTKAMNSGFEFNYTLYFDEKGTLDYLLYSLEPEKTNYKLDEKGKELFLMILKECTKNYQSDVIAFKKYKFFLGYTQQFKKK